MSKRLKRNHVDQYLQAQYFKTTMKSQEKNPGSRSVIEYYHKVIWEFFGEATIALITNILLEGIW